MSKVLVDRELLERCVDRWACCAIVETPGAEQAWLELRAVVKAAQPAEAEVVRDYLAKFAEGEVEAKTAIEELQDALSAVTAERDRLLSENARLIEDRARFPDRPDDIGHMIGSHIGNLKAGKVQAEKYARKWRDNLDSEIRAVDQLRAEVDALRKVIRAALYYVPEHKHDLREIMSAAMAAKEA